MATPDEILMQRMDAIVSSLAQGLKAKADQAANVALGRAMRQIDAKSAEVVNKARNAVIASGLIGGTLGGVLVLVLQKLWKKYRG